MVRTERPILFRGMSKEHQEHIYRTSSCSRDPIKWRHGAWYERSSASFRWCYIRHRGAHRIQRIFEEKLEVVSQHVNPHGDSFEQTHLRQLRYIPRIFSAIGWQT